MSAHPDMTFFLSGKAHVYYGALAIIGLSAVAILQFRNLATLLPLFLLLIAAMAAGIFVDVWVHGYRH